MTIVLLYASAAMAVAWYFRGTRRLGGRGRTWPVGRTIAFITGILVLCGANQVPDETFTGHMIAHIGLGMLGPMLLALGAPVTLALQTAAEPYRSWLRRILHLRVAQFLLHPVVGWSLFGTTIVGLYFTRFLVISERNDWVHALLHAHLIIVGCIFLWPLVGLDPVPNRLPFGARLVAVLLAAPFHAFVGLAIVSATTPVAAGLYDSLPDQRRAAAMLWISGEVMSVVLAGLVFRAWLAADRREAARFDRFDRQPTALAKGVE